MFTCALISSARTNNFKFKFLSLFLSLCHAHTLQLHITTDEEAAASKRMVFYDFYVFQRKKTIFIKFIYLTNFALHSFLFVFESRVLTLFFQLMKA